MRVIDYMYTMEKKGSGIESESEDMPIVVTKDKMSKTALSPRKENVSMPSGRLRKT